MIFSLIVFIFIRDKFKKYLLDEYSKEEIEKIKSLIESGYLSLRDDDNIKISLILSMLFLFLSLFDCNFLLLFTGLVSALIEYILLKIYYANKIQKALRELKNFYE